MESEKLSSSEGLQCRESSQGKVTREREIVSGERQNRPRRRP